MKVADMHGDTVYELLKRRRMGETISLLKNNLHMDLQKMKQADYLLQNFAMFVELSACENPYEEGRDFAGILL